jgi:class 3 adenylate cyclase
MYALDAVRSHAALARVLHNGAMRVERSFAFLDLSGFTSFNEEQGDEKAVDALSEFRAAVRAVASDRAVRIAKWLGDGAMLVSVNHGPLVAAVLDLVDDPRGPLALRAGMSVGEVILIDGEDYIGGQVNLAARLLDIAAPGELLATPEICAFVPPSALASHVVLREIKGFAHPIPVVSLRVVGQPGSPTVL